MRRAALIAALAACALLCGCEAEQTEFTTTEYGVARFELHNASSWEANNVYVLVDRDTGVEYLTRSNGGICPLYEADGSLMLVGEANRPEVSDEAE